MQLKAKGWPMAGVSFCTPVSLHESAPTKSGRAMDAPQSSKDSIPAARCEKEGRGWGPCPLSPEPRGPRAERALRRHCAAASGSQRSQPRPPAFPSQGSLRRPPHALPPRPLPPCGCGSPRPSSEPAHQRHRPEGSEVGGEVAAGAAGGSSPPGRGGSPFCPPAGAAQAHAPRPPRRRGPSPGRVVAPGPHQRAARACLAPREPPGRGPERNPQAATHREKPARPTGRGPAGQEGGSRRAP